MRKIVCKLDWFPNPWIRDTSLNEVEIVHLLRYCIFVYTNGDGSKLFDMSAYPIKRLFGTYRRISLNKVDPSSVIFGLPSPMELVRYARSDKGPSELSRMILEEGVICEETLQALCAEYMTAKGVRK